MPHLHTESGSRRRARALAALLLVTLPAAACRTSSIYTPDVQMQLALAPGQVRAGETLRLEFTLTNPQPDSVVLEFGEECRVSFLVMDPEQRVIHPNGDKLCLAPGGGRLALPGGGTWKASGEWKAAASDGTPAAPGRYLVRAVLGEHDSVHRGRRDFKLGHAADTLAFTVLPPQAP